MRVTFLLGAGISRDLLPLGGQIDEIVQTGKANDGRTVSRDSIGLYDLMEAKDPRHGLDEWRPRVVAFLDWLRGWLPEDQRHYEALYYACQQVHDEVTGEYENPILWPFIEKCMAQLPNCWGYDSTDGFGPPLSPVSKINFLTREATDYIGGVVSAALKPATDAAAKLGPLHAALLGACEDSTISCVDVVTLNHDTLLENSFSQAGVEAEDGFKLSKLFPGLRRWTGYKASGRSRVRLVKLHGSVDWWDVRYLGGPRHSALVRADGCPLRLQDRFGRMWDGIRRSSILVGTSNKMLDYLRPGNLTRLAVSRRALMHSNALVVAGYSFRDKGVNNLLVDWARPGRRMVVLSPHLSGDSPPETARPAVKTEWPTWVTTRILKPLPERFDALSWPMLRRHLAGH